MDTQQQSASSAQPARTSEEVEAVVIRFCGDSGDGMQLTGGEFTKATALAGNDLSTLPDFPARLPAGARAYRDFSFSSRRARSTRLAINRTRWWR